MSDLLVEIVLIDEVNSHPNADRLELAVVKGWQCCVPKNIYKKGDKVLYIPIDSILPMEVESKLFPHDAKVKLSKSRVKTIKLRGALSQGMIASLDMFGLDKGKVGTNVKDKLKIEKYEQPIKGSNGMNVSKVTKRNSNPNFKKYTSIQNFKNYNKLFEDGEAIIVTEKIHGTNFRAGWVKRDTDKWYIRLLLKLNILKSECFVFGSHNVQLQDRLLHTGYYKTNVYSEAVKLYDLKEKLRDRDTVIYGEIYGSGIQKGYTYGCKEDVRKLIIFDVMENGFYLDTENAINVVNSLGLDFVPVLYMGKYSDTVKELPKGNSVLCPEQKVREGVVIKPVEESESYMGRKILKLINDDYLLSKNNTDFH